MSTKLFRRLLATATLVLLGQFVVAPAAQAQVITVRPQARILQPIDGKVTSSFTNSTPRALAKAADLGPVAANTPMHVALVLKSSDAQEHALRTLLDQQHDSGTASFHKWITPDQFGASFGVADADIQKITGWLQSQGFSVDSVAKGRRLITFSGTSGQVASAFHTSMHSYNLGGETHIANSTDISIPAALQNVVKSAPVLNDFMSKSDIGPMQHVRMGSDGNLHLDPNYPNAELRPGAHFVSPGDFAKIYNTTPSGADGSGVTIGIVGRSAILLSDVQAYRRAFHLPDNDPTIVNVGAAPGHTEAELESDLDVEESGGIAPMAKILYAPAASSFNSDGIGLSSISFVENNTVDIISVSYGNCEANTGSGFWDTLWEQAAAQGQSVFVSTGDNGAFGCDPQFSGGTAFQGLAVSGLASTPFNTAVGGTQFSEGTGTFWATVANQTAGYVSALGYIPEAGWDEGQINGGGPVLAASSGGISTLFTRPSWQTGSGIDDTKDPRDVGQGTGPHRLLPDISFNSAGHDATLVCFGGVCELNSDGTLANFGAVEGTSVAAPSMAGVQALIDQKNGGRQGLGNYFYYKLSAAQTEADCNSTGVTAPLATCTFNDVTTGSNRELIPGIIFTGLPGGPGFLPVGPANDGFDATTGYDLVTGLGSINVSNLIKNWSTVKFNSTTTTFTLTPAKAAHGTAVSFTAAVAPGSGTGKPTGDVTLVLTPSSQGGPASLNLNNFVFGGNVFQIAADGTVTGSVTGLPGGTYTVAARYAGDGVFASSTSAPVTVTISPETSTTAVLPALYFANNGSLTPSATFKIGQTIFIETQVQSTSGNGTATGTVVFTDNGKPLATLSLNPTGEISLVAGPPPANFANQFPQNTPAFGLGNHSIVATYSGDSGLSGSASAPVTFSVGPAAQSLILVSSAAQITSGASVILTASVPTTTVDRSTLANNATGAITFFDGATSLGTANLVNNVASFSTTAITTAGAHNITAQYAGDANFAAATSNTATVTVGNGAATTVALTLSTTTPVLNTNVVYQVVVSPAPGQIALLTGTVNLYDGTTLLGSIFVNPAGLANLQSQVPAAGAHQITAAYAGNATYAASTSPAVTETVSPAPTTLNLTSKSTGIYGEQTALVAVWLNGAGTGSRPNLPTQPISFFDGTTLLGTAPLTRQTFTTGSLIANFTTNLLGAGTHTLTAVFPAEANYLTSTSNVQSLVVAQAPSTTTLTLAPVTAIQGQTITLTANVAVSGPAPATGTVTFFDGTTLLGTSPVNAAGVATLATSFLATGPHSLTATYSGDANYTGSSSTASATTTAAITPAFTLSANPGSLIINRGENGFVALTITPGAGFSGTVTLSCSNLPTNATCFFTSQTVNLGGGTQTVELILKGHQASSTVASMTRPAGDMPSPIPALAFWLPGAALSGFGLGRKRSARQRQMLLLAIFVLGLGGMMGLTGCGAGNGVSAAPGTYNVQVTGTSGAITNSAPLTITIK